MPTETLRTVQPSGQTIYAVVWYQGTYFDWTDTAFETPSAGSHAQAALAATERTRGVQSTYETAAINLATLWNYMAPREFLVVWYSQAGGSPDPTTDPEIRVDALTVQMGHRGDGDNPPVIDLQITPGYRIDEDPDMATWWITVTANGNPVDMYALDDSPAVSCAIVLREEDAGADEFTANVSAADSTYGRFYVEQSNPGFTAERVYIGRVTLTSGSDTIVRDCPFLAAG